MMHTFTTSLDIEGYEYEVNVKYMVYRFVNDFGKDDSEIEIHSVKVITESKEEAEWPYLERVEELIKTRIIEGEE